MDSIKVIRRKNFTTIDNSVFLNKRLSYKAKGLFCQLISLPPYWNYSLKGLSSLSSDGIDSVRSALKELISSGYVVVNRKHDQSGKFIGMEYIVRDDPLLDFPHMDKPILENPTQLNTINKSINKSIKKNRPDFNDFSQNHYDMKLLESILIQN